MGPTDSRSGAGLGRREAHQIDASGGPGLPRPTDAAGRFLRAAKATATIVAILFACFCFQYQRSHPPCCDVDSYLQIGKALARSGFGPTAPGEIRLYGYPTVIAALAPLAQALSQPIVYLLFPLQLAFYLLTARWTASLVADHSSQRLGDLTYLALVGNVAIYPYLAIPLSDGISTTLHVLIAGAILRLFRADSLEHPSGVARRVPALLLLGFLVGFAIMIRPANLYLIAPAAVAVALFVARADRWRVAGLAGLATLAAFWIAVTPQVLYNRAEHGVTGFLPAADLGEAQVDWGIAYLEYATNLSGGAEQLRTRNPWAVSGESSLEWYFTQPIAGAKTVAFHLFAALDLDHLFPYPYDLDPPYAVLIFLLGHSIVFWGGFGYFLAVLARARPDRSTIERMRPKLLEFLYPVLLLGWASVHAVAAVEDRFSLPILTALIPLASWGLVTTARRSRPWLVLTASGAFAAYLLLAWWLSEFLEGLREMPVG